MSQSMLAIFAAITGSVVTFIGTYLSRARDKFAARVGAMEVTRSEIKAAAETVDTTLKKGVLWSASRQLRSRAWETHGAALASHLKTATWREIDCRVRSLSRMEEWANEIRDEKNEARKAKFAESLGEVAKELPEAIEILDTAIEYAYSRRTRSSIFAVACTVALLVAGWAIVAGSASQARTDVANELRAQIPAARHVICEKSGDFEGAYRCAVEVGSCHGQLEAATGKPQCSATKTTFIDVASGSACDFYEQEKPRGPPSKRAPPRWKQVLNSGFEWICKKR